MMKKYLTVLLEYDDGAELPQEITKAFASDARDFKDTKVIAVSTEDEFARLETLEERLASQ